MNLIIADKSGVTCCESQMDSRSKSRVARHELPWVIPGQIPQPQRGYVMPAATGYNPVGVGVLLAELSQGSSLPRNPGLKDAIPLGLSRNDTVRKCPPGSGEAQMQGSAEFIPLQRGSPFGIRCLPVVIALKRNKFRAPLVYRRFLNGIAPAKEAARKLVRNVSEE